MSHRHATRTRLALASLVAVALLAACGSDEASSDGESDAPPVTPSNTLPEVDAPTVTTAPTTGDTTSDPSGTGTVAVRLEEVDGIFIEGFEVGLRFETLDGDVIDSTLWTDFVTAQGDPDIDAFYDSVLDQTVPAGDVVVLATVNVGAGPGPEVPDLRGDLRCRLVVDVPADGSVDVVVTFSGDDDCLQLG